jgi:GTPase SAR1 family protein
VAIEDSSSLTNRSKHQEIDIYRMRIMLVGPGFSGKTTLAHRIMEGKFLKDIPMTDGVLMKEWNPPSRNETIALSVWDFGGQEVYLNTHPLFFSEESLYLLVWNPRAPLTASLLEEYLLQIRTKTPSSPIVLVTTHSEEIGNGNHVQTYLNDLRKYGCMEHFPVDSRTGQGIDDLKKRLIELVTSDYTHYSYARVPNWYSKAESQLRELSKNKFSISSQELLQLLESERAAYFETNENIAEIRSLEELASYFHRWGTVFSLPTDEKNSATVVLSPQQLAVVFQSVISCHNDPTRQMFPDGVLNHRSASLVWPNHESNVHTQFLHLFHAYELAYEIFDSQGRRLDQSLIPCLLPVVSIPNNGRQVREEFLVPSWQSEFQSSNISVIIEFDSCWMSNFFVKLMVRLRHMTSKSDCSRHHCVVHLPHLEGDAVTGQSVACVVEHQSSKSLHVYPGGRSFAATVFVHQAIRGLIEESRLTPKITLRAGSGGEFVFTHTILENHLKENPSTPFSLSQTLSISLKFLSSLFFGMDLARPLQELRDLSGLMLSQLELQTLRGLESSLERYQNTSDPLDKMDLFQHLLRSIPIVRCYGLGLSRLPPILWLASSTTSSSRQIIAVSSNISPCHPWVIVRESTIPLENDLPEVNQMLSDLILKSVMKFIPENEINFSGRLVYCQSGDLPTLIASREKEYFVKDNDHSGDRVCYSRSVFEEMKGEPRLARFREVVEDVMFDFSLRFSH